MTVPSVPDTVLGIDVSVFQSTTDYDTAPLGFLFARASIGTAPDTMFQKHKAKAKAAGLPFGAYHFNAGSIPVADQVALFLGLAGDADLLALDVEGKDPFTLAQAEKFIAKVQQTGRRIGLYMSESAFLEAGQDWDWVANWGPDGPATTEPVRHWDIWQFGPFKGEDGDLAKTAFLQGELGSPMSIYAAKPRTGTFTIPGGKETKVYQPGDNGWDVAKTYTPTALYTAHYDQGLSRLSGTTLPSTLLHVSDGGLAGFYVATADVDETDDPPVVDDTPFSQAALDAAIAADRAKATVGVVYP